MTRIARILAATLFVSTGAAAQGLKDVPAPVALADTVPRTVYATPIAPDTRNYPHLYGGNLAANPNDRAFDGRYRTDPRLLMGLAIAPGIGFEAGYVNLLDRGFHPIDERDPEDTTGALGQKGFNTHLALRYTRPLGERLTAWGKLGVAHTEQRIGQRQGVDTGLYTGIGAHYRVSERTSVSGGFENHGKAAERWNDNTNSSSSVKASLKMGF